MPLYEYYCEPCKGVFELLRPAKDAAKPQPCPRCDEDAKRIVSKQWSAYIFREGFPRRLPDDGGYWHLGQKVSQPMLSLSSDGEHQELRGTRPEHTAPSIDEIEQFEFRQEVKAEIGRQHGANVVDTAAESQDSFFKARLQKTRGTRSEEAAKKRALQTTQRVKRQMKEDRAAD